MPLKSLVAQVWQDREAVAYRPSQVYTTAIGLYNLFTITGPVLITLLGGREIANTGGEDIDVTVNGYHTDAAGAVVIGVGAGLVWVTSLNIAGTLLNAAAVPLTVALLHPHGLVSGISVGNISATFATGTSWTGDIFCVYRKLSPDARVFAT